MDTTQTLFSCDEVLASSDSESSNSERWTKVINSSVRRKKDTRCTATPSKRLPQKPSPKEQPEQSSPNTKVKFSHQTLLINAPQWNGEFPVMIALSTDHPALKPARTNPHSDPCQGSSISGHSPEHQVSTAEARQLHQSEQVRHRSKSATRVSKGSFKGHHIFSYGGRSHGWLELHSKGSSASNEHQNLVRRQPPSQFRDWSSRIIQPKTIHARSDPLLPLLTVGFAARITVLQNA